MADRKLYTPETLDAAVQRYLDECAANDTIADEAGMRIALGISLRTMQRYAAESEEMASTFARARDYRESWLVRRMVSEPKLAQGCLNALKQPSNGGYIDRPVGDTGPREITVKIQGLGDGALS